MISFRAAMTAMLTLIAVLGIASGVMLAVVAHDRPLHRAYACQFAKDFRHEVHLPAAPGHPCQLAS